MGAAVVIAVGDCAGRISGQSGGGDILAELAEFWTGVWAGYAAGAESGDTGCHLRAEHPDYHGQHYRGGCGAYHLQIYLKQLHFFEIVIQYCLWGYSSAGRALRSQRRGREFESRYLHTV